MTELSSHAREAILVSDDRSKSCRVLQASEMELDSVLSCELMDSFRLIAAHLSPISKVQKWRQCLVFCRFLRSFGVDVSKGIPPNILIEYQSWLDRSDYAEDTRRSLLGAARRLLGSVRKGGSVCPIKPNLNVFYQGHSPSVQRKVLSRTDLKQIFDICCDLVKDVETRIENRFDSVLFEAFDPESTLLRELLIQGKGRLPKLSIAARLGANLVRRIESAGGMTHLARAIFPTTDDAFVFYLALLIQTSGNPDGIRRLQVDCIKSHPLRDDIEWLTWSKPRSHREQKVDSIVGRKNSAANLVRRYLSLSGRVRDLAPSHLENNLLLAYGKAGPTLPSSAHLCDLLKDFIVEFDLPDFTFRDIRASTAEMIYSVSRDIRDVKIRLNHNDIRTTARYLNTHAIREENERLIFHFQGVLLRAANVKNESTISSPTRMTSKSVPTLFGFDCVDPFSGIAEGAKVGEMCPAFTRCATCPGALVPIDDVHVVAKLLAARRTLRKLAETAAKNGWQERFDVVYLPTLRIIEDEILEKIPESILSVAENLSQCLRLPILE